MIYCVNSPGTGTRVAVQFKMSNSTAYYEGPLGEKGHQFIHHTEMMYSTLVRLLISNEHGNNNICNFGELFFRFVLLFSSFVFKHAINSVILVQTFQYNQ